MRTKVLHVFIVIQTKSKSYFNDFFEENIEKLMRSYYRHLPLSFCALSCISTPICHTQNPLFPNRSCYLVRLGVLRVCCHLSLILEHKIRCFLVISLVFTVKIDAAVFSTYLRSVRTISNLRSFSNPPTTRAG